MSEFNANAFREEAKAAGYSDDVIESEIKKYSKNINSATGQEFGAAGEKEIQGQAQKWRDEGNVMPGTKTPEDTRNTGEQLNQWFNTPEGTAVAGLLVGAGGVAGLNYWNSLRNRKEGASGNFEAPKREPIFGNEDFLKPTVAAGEPTIQPAAKPLPAGPVPAPTYPVAAQQQPAISGYGQQTMNAPTGVPAPVAPAEPAAPVISAKDQATIDLANAKREAVLADIKRKDELHAQALAGKVKSDVAKEQKNQGAAGRPGSKQEAEKQMVKSSIIAQEDKATAAALKAQNKKPITGAVAPTPTPAPATAPVQTVVAATPEPGPAVVVEKPPEKAPKPKIVLPEGWGKGMTWLVNQHGVEGAEDFINRYNNGKPFSSHDEMMKSYLANTTRPKYSDIPKDVRKSRGIVPPAQTMAPGMSGAAIPPRTNLGPQQDLTQGGGSVLHMLNPMKL